MVFLKYGKKPILWYGKTQVFESCGFLMVETEIYTNPRHRIINFSDHGKGMGKLKEFPSYEFLNIFGVKYVESLKYGKSEFAYNRKKYGKAQTISHYWVP